MPDSKVEFGFGGLSNKDCTNKNNCTYGEYAVTTCRHLCAICMQLQRMNTLLEQMVMQQRNSK